MTTTKKATDDYVCQFRDDLQREDHGECACSSKQMPVSLADIAFALLGLVMFLSVMCALVAAVLIYVAKPVRAHDMYGDWLIPGTTVSCCHNEDCAPTEHRIVYMPDSVDLPVIQVFVRDRWVNVPMDRVLTDVVAHDGRSHVCAGKDLNMNKTGYDAGNRPLRGAPNILCVVIAGTS